jgi:hypothetical protein
MPSFRGAVSWAFIFRDSGGRASDFNHRRHFDESNAQSTKACRELVFSLYIMPIFVFSFGGARAAGEARAQGLELELRYGPA